jgi:hypothetical protein
MIGPRSPEYQHFRLRLFHGIGSAVVQARRFPEIKVPQCFANSKVKHKDDYANQSDIQNKFSNHSVRIENR